MRPSLKKGLIAFSIGIAALPVAAIVTFLLVPFWRWLEAKTEIESIGHSGPADWCFVAVYVLFLAAGLGVWFQTRAKNRTNS